MLAELKPDFRERVLVWLREQGPRQPGQPITFIYARASSDPHGRGWSVERQIEAGFGDAKRSGWFVGGVFVDNDRSASAYATKGRPDFERMVALMARGECNILVCWEASRATRDLRCYLELSEIAKEFGIQWCFSGRMYDLTDPDDEFRSLLDVGLSAREVGVLRKRVLDGIRKAAADGRPHGRVPYGYYRVYDPHARVFVAQLIDDRPRERAAADGSMVSYTPAEIVADIFHRLAGGDTRWAIARDLNARNIPAPKGGAWTMRRVGGIALNQAYAGWRIRRGERVRLGIWDPIVDHATLDRVMCMLADPARKTRRPNAVKHLLSHRARCGVCQDWLRARNKGTHNRRRRRIYKCRTGLCVSIGADDLDAYVESVMIERLADPATLDWLVRPDDTAAQQAAEEAAALRARLAEWKDKAGNGEVAPADYTDITASLRARIAEMEAMARPTHVPVVLSELVGEHAEQAWDALTMTQKREVLTCTLDIEVGRNTGARGFRPDRLRLTWLLDQTANAAPVAVAASPSLRLGPVERLPERAAAA